MNVASKLLGKFSKLKGKKFGGVKVENMFGGLGKNKKIL